MASTIAPGSPIGRGALVMIVDRDGVDHGDLVTALRTAGLSTVVRTTASGLVDAIELLAPDVLVIEPSLPGSSAVAVLTEVRRASDVAILVVSDVAEEPDRVIGLELGADDYIAKPSTTREITARVRALLRRTGSVSMPGAARLDFGRLVIHPSTRETLVDGTERPLTGREFELLVHLAQSPRTVFSREDLLDAVWNSSGQWQSVSTVTEHVRRIRLKLAVEDGHDWIETIWGVGYRFSG